MKKGLKYFYATSISINFVFNRGQYLQAGNFKGSFSLVLWVLGKHEQDCLFLASCHSVHQGMDEIGR